MRMTVGYGGMAQKTTYGYIGRNNKLYKELPGGITAAIGIFIAIIFIVVGAVMFNSTQTFMKTAVETQATISEIRAYSENDYVVTVSFQTKDGVQQNVRLGRYSSNMRVGQELKIYYDPANPANISSGVTLSVLLPGGLGILFGTIITVIGFVMMKNRRENERLKREGERYLANVSDCKVDTRITDTSNGSRTYRTRQLEYTFTLFCRYLGHDGKTYECKSRALSYDPRPYLPDGKISLYVDKQNPKKYFMDILASMDDNIVSV